MFRLLVPSLVLLCAAPAGAASFTWAAYGGPSLRLALDSDDRGSGLEAIAGGGELYAGVAFGSLGVVLEGHASGGRSNGARWIDAGGGLAFQLQLGERVRLRVGADGGRIFLGGSSSGPPPEEPWFAGGFLGGSFDLVRFAGGRAALALAVRVDVDFVTRSVSLPPVTMGLATSVGLRW